MANPYPGVDPDGKNPGGLQVAGQVEAATVKLGQLLTDGTLTLQDLFIIATLTLGTTNDVDENTFISLFGSLYVQESVGLAAGGDDLMDIISDKPVTAGGGTRALQTIRQGDITAHDYNKEHVKIFDQTASGASLLTVDKAAGTGLAIELHGRLGVSNPVTRGEGVYSGKSLPLYDTDNNLLGYLPIES